MTNIINLITTIRIMLAPIILFLLMTGNYLLSTLLFFLAGLTDYLDGYLARKYNAESQLGEILDPIADKILIVFILLGLSVSLDSFLIAFLSSLIIAREIGVAALRDYSSRNNISDRTKVVFLAKFKTAVQLFTIGSYLLAMTLNLNLLIVLSDILLIIATLITLYTGYQYALKVSQK
jgi:CDP-diacylglycerol--glycerol-3-phosphate 3-phosphatidyltransferase